MVVERFKTMNEFEGNVRVVIERFGRRRCLGRKSKKKNHGPGADLTNWLWQEMNLLTL